MCPSISPGDYARLTDAAKRQANSLRNQAINDFWRQACQAARRLARSLARHGQPGKQQGA